MSDSIELQILEQIWQHVDRNTNVPPYARLPVNTLSVDPDDSTDMTMVPVMSQNQPGHTLFGSSAAINLTSVSGLGIVLRLTRGDEEKVTVQNLCVHCGSLMR